MRPSISSGPAWSNRDGRGHPKDLNPTWMGHSVGRWEGDTLVIDTVGTNDKSWLNIYPHTEQLHLVEHYT